MSPEDIIQRLLYHTPTILGQEDYREYGILIPITNVDGEAHLLFEVRALNMRSQPGDVCFPGGRLEKIDANAQACAVRETCEELGISASHIKHVQALGYFISEGRMIHLFTGFVQDLSVIRPNQAEVDHVFTVPLTFFQETIPDLYQVAFEPIPEKNFPFDLIQGGENYNWHKRHLDELFYQYEDRVIWGLTAYIVTRFMKIISSN
ncbi:NUDIX hydrolase [Lentibacillus saliphilus]|uniref:NUDIX hydrolase n=1 Tax=Lentibacillus saliphilus TaxID=2737028 RepID=UPI001C2F2207|nr:CoA pyrophosphatase [Lentibacillus saliphilus]